MIDFFPKPIAHRAMLTYLGVLLGVSVIFLPFAIGPFFMVTGALCVAVFFYLSYVLSYRWRLHPRNAFIFYLSGTALLVRIVGMTAMYYYFIMETGIPFEYNAVDSIGYHLDAEWMASVSIPTSMTYLRNIIQSLSDKGYFFYLSFLYRAFGPDIYLTRVIKCLLDTISCVLVYRMAERHFDEATGRLAGLFYCFMPNLIFYCGVHLKETEMIFITIVALERLSYVMSKDSIDIPNTLLVTLLTAILFTFRTVLALSVIFSVLTTVVFVTFRKRNSWHHIGIILWVVLSMSLLASGTIANDISTTWENRVENQLSKRGEQTARGNLWAKYATSSVMAPMMFVIPFPTMVDVDNQYTQQMLHGGNYVRNFLGIFVLITVFESFLVRRDWRKIILILSFVVSYLGIVCLSGFANSERFVLPALPILLILAAAGVTHLNDKNIRYVRIWYWIVPLMPVGWAIFKLGSRGLL